MDCLQCVFEGLRMWYVSYYILIWLQIVEANKVIDSCTAQQSKYSYAWFCNSTFKNFYEARIPDTKILFAHTSTHCFFYIDRNADQDKVLLIDFIEHVKVSHPILLQPPFIETDRLLFIINCPGFEEYNIHTKLLYIWKTPFDVDFNLDDGSFYMCDKVKSYPRPWTKNGMKGDVFNTTGCRRIEFGKYGDNSAEVVFVICFIISNFCVIFILLALKYRQNIGKNRVYHLGGRGRH